MRFIASSFSLIIIIELRFDDSARFNDRVLRDHNDAVTDIVAFRLIRVILFRSRGEGLDDDVVSDAGILIDNRVFDAAVFPDADQHTCVGIIMVSLEDILFRFRTHNDTVLDDSALADGYVTADDTVLNSAFDHSAVGNDGTCNLGACLVLCR